MAQGVRLSLPAAVLARREGVNWHAIFMVVMTGVVLYLVVVPLAVAVFATLRPRGLLPFEAGGISLDNYVRVFLDPTNWALMGNTLVFALGSLAIGTACAIAMAWLVERTDLPLNNLVFSIVIAPMAIPGMLAAIAWIFLLDPNIGLLNSILRAPLGLFGLDVTSGPLNIYTLYGMVLVEGIRMVPTLFLMIAGAFRGMDPSLEEASRVAGHSPTGTFLRVTLPIMRPAILGAMLYYFIVAIEAFEIPGVLGLSAGIHVFSTRIYWAIHPSAGGMPDYGMASTLGVLVMVISIGLIWLYNRLTSNTRGFVTITGKGFRPYRLRLGRWRYPALAFCALYALLALILPAFILLWTSLHNFYVPPTLDGLRTLTLAPYVFLKNHPVLPLAFGNTVVLVALTATATMLLSMFVGWLIVRGRSRLRGVLDMVSFLPQALPSIVIALAVMLVYLSFRNPFYGTIFIIAIAMTTRYLAYGSRVMKAGFMQIHPELEEASRVAGVGWWRTYALVIIPLAAPVLINGWMWVAVHAARELSVALMLYTPSSVVVSTQVWSLWEAGRQPAAAALGVLLIAALVLVNWIARLTLQRVHFF
jgi:iron(III) transport system permease protein